MTNEESMKNIIAFVLVAFLAACNAVQGDTPLQRYYGLQTDYRTIQKVAVTYKNGCAKTAQEHPCHKDVTNIQAISRRVQGTFDAAETARLIGINADFATSVAIAGTALGELSTYLQHTSEVK